MSLQDKVSRSLERMVHSRPVLDWRLQDVDRRTRDIYHRVAPYTMTSPERIAAVCDAVRHVDRARIPGAYVECGVWRGGSSMAAALSLLEAGDPERELCLFDTFEGMSAPTEHDLRANDRAPAARLLESSAPQDTMWCRASLEDVSANMASTGYPPGLINYCKGMVESTLPHQAPDRIAILRLDTDWYESTRHELEHLYPRLAVGGVLIIDDYGYWAGARKAVDEYFAERPILLNRIDRTGRIAVKVAA
ncbi:MAG TPA: TylF/MycF/NovP-related O-methyltransferase [Croceibacterium sp.]